MVTGGVVNLVAYEGVESAANFPDAAALKRYRRFALDRSRPQAAFIGRHAGRALDVVEIGCGNGRLGFALQEAGIARRYEGLDVSKSRVAFARKWAADFGLGEVAFAETDAMSWAPAAPRDAVVCITGAFGYFEPMAPDGAARLLQACAAACRPGGWLVLEIYNHRSLEQRLLGSPGYILREWSPLPEADPFEFYLHEFRYDPAKRLLQHVKVFIPRDAGRRVDRRTEVIKLYGRQELDALVESAGFRVVARYADWNDAPDDDGDAVILIAQRESAG